MPRALGFRNLLVPVTANAKSERAMDVACRLAAERGALITVVSVVEIPPLLPLDAHMRDEERAAHLVLERVAAIADTYGVGVAPRILRGRAAGDVIVAEADRRGTELIVIGAPRKHRSAFGTTVEHVLKKATCCVLVIADAPAAAPIARYAAA